MTTILASSPKIRAIQKGSRLLHIVFKYIIELFKEYEEG